MSAVTPPLDHYRLAALLRAAGIAPTELRGADWGTLTIVPAPTPAQLAALRAAYGDPAQGLSQRKTDLAAVQAALPAGVRVAFARLLGADG